MKLALLEAQTAFDTGEVPVGAVVVENDTVIAKSHNQVELLKDCTAHAEMIALTSAFSYLGTKYLPKATLYVTLEPCLMCCGALKWSQIGRIVFGALDKKNGFQEYFESTHKAQTVFHPKTQLISGILAEESALLLKSFFNNRRR